jgi:hypothetical protein
MAYTNLYRARNPWVRQMVAREPEIYWVYKRGGRYTDVDAGLAPEAGPHVCGICKGEAWYRPTVGRVICPDCGAMDISGNGDFEPCNHDRCTYTGGGCPMPSNSCSKCDWMRKVN